MIPFIVLIIVLLAGLFALNEFQNQTADRIGSTHGTAAEDADLSRPTLLQGPLIRR